MIERDVMSDLQKVSDHVLKALKGVNTVLYNLDDKYDELTKEEKNVYDLLESIHDFLCDSLDAFTWLRGYLV